jgi:type VI secretion system protein ImpJ
VSHPFSLYLALCSLAGQVASVGVDLVPPLFPRYDHQDPRGSFLAVTDFIERALAQGISELYTRVPFRLEGNAFFVESFDPDWVARKLVLEVRGQSGSTPRQVQQWVNSCRIGSESCQRMMREKRILGLAREQLQGREGLVARHGALLWSLKPDPAFLVPHEKLRLENNHEPPDVPLPVEVSLLIPTRA